MFSFFKSNLQKQTFCVSRVIKGFDYSRNGSKFIFFNFTKNIKTQTFDFYNALLSQKSL